jgi:hypothetical protein
MYDERRAKDWKRAYGVESAEDFRRQLEGANAYLEARGFVRRGFTWLGRLRGRHTAICLTPAGAYVFFGARCPRGERCEKRFTCNMVRDGHGPQEALPQRGEITGPSLVEAFKQAIEWAESQD